MSTTVRAPAVAGQFYPGKAQVLEQEVDAYTRGSEATGAAAEKIRALGCVVPHAGYMYSGHVAGVVYGRLLLPKRFIILCPNHTGMGDPLAIMSEGRWLTPLGEARIDGELAAALKHHFKLLSEDASAHLKEHAIEVQLPFLQRLQPEFSFVPIVIGTSRLEVLQALGKIIAEAVAQTSDRVLVIASSDMNHYESDQVTRLKDGKALDRILHLDPSGLYEVVTQNNITMCGFGPAVAMLTASKQLGATQAELIKYATSGDVSGDRDMVVGYAGVAVS